MAKKVKKTLFRLPYFGVLLVVTVLVLIFLVDKKVVPFVSDTNISLQTPVLQTEVINFRPDVPSETKEGSCFSTSVSAPSSSTAYRCSVGNMIYDPCILGSDEKTLVCDADPAKGVEGFALKTTGTLPDPVEGDDLSSPWMIELASGRICSLAQGASGMVGNERINYYCESGDEDINIVIIGDLKKGKLWYATRAEIEGGPPQITVAQESIVPLKRVWLIQ